MQQLSSDEFDIESAAPVADDFDFNSAVALPIENEKLYLENQQATVELPNGGIKRLQAIVGGAYDKGTAGRALNELYSRQMFGDDSPQVEQSIRQLRESASKNFGLEPWSIEDIARASAEQTPQLLGLAETVTRRGLQGSMLGGTAALVAGQAGPQIATPEEIVTVPAAALTGGVIGARYGMAEYSFMQNAGEAYGEFSEFLDKSGQKIENKNLARLGAVMVGALNAGLDTISFGQLSKVFVGKNLVFDSLQATGAKSIAIPKTKEAIFKWVLEYGKYIAVESATEGLQEGTKGLGGNIVKNLSTQEFTNQTAEQIFTNMGEAANEAAKVSAIFGGFGGGVRAGISVVSKENAGTISDPNLAAKALIESEAIKPEIKQAVQVLSEQSPDFSMGDLKQIVESVEQQDPQATAQVLMKTATPEVKAAIEALPEGFTMEQLQEAARPTRDPMLLENYRRSLESARNQTSKITEELSRKRPLITMIRRMGGIRVGSVIDQELRSMGITPKTAPGLFKKNKGVGDIDNIPADEFLEKFGIPPQTDETGNYVDRNWLIEQLDREISGNPIGSEQELSSGDNFIEELNNAGLDYKTATPEQVYDALDSEQKDAFEAKLEREAIQGDAAKVGEQKKVDKRAEADYAKVAEQVEKGTLGDDTRYILDDVMKVGGDLFAPVSTRLGKIDQKLKHAVRKFLFQNGLYNHKDKQVVKPFIEKVSEMSEADYRILDLALKNRDQAKIDELVNKYGIAKEFRGVRKILDNLYAEAQEVGLDMNYLNDYFPRMVKRNKVLEYMAAMRGREEWTEIEAALEAADPEQVFTPEEQAEFVDNFLRGYTTNKITLAKGGFTKQRAVDYVSPEFNQYYESSPQALMQYIDAVRHGIETRRLFGKGNAEASIGTYVNSLVKEGSVKQHQVEELKKILKGIVEPQGTRGVVSWAKNVTYIYVMGSPISAITQIQDLGFSLAFNGYYRTGKAMTKAILGKSEITQKDLGLDNILQEFSDESRAGRAVRKVFKAVGFSYVDNIGSETYMNAALDRLRAENRKNKKAFNKEMEVIFGEEAEQVKKDLAAGVMSENVMYLGYSELLDVQPKALSEMPVHYLNGGNGRIFYMLKSYTLKQIDIYRRKIFDEIASGESERMIKGTQNIIRLSIALMLMGMTSDALKDLLLGREIEPDELVLDNLLKLTGVTKFQIYKARQEGVMTTFFKTLFVPPVGAPIDDAVKDINKIAIEGDKDITEAETAKGVPVVGKLYYWWLGGGADK